jgi:syntaxin-binding protein 1
MKTVLEELATNELSMEDYPSVLPMPDMGPSQGSSASGGRRGAGGAGGAGGSARQSRAGQAASARKAGGPTSRWGKSSTRQASASSGPKSFNGGRAIVFMMGGLSYSEMRVARQVMMKESREVVIGSTAFVSPQEFVEDLAALSAGDA